MYKIIHLDYFGEKILLKTDFENIKKIESVLGCSIQTWGLKASEDCIFTAEKLMELLSLFVSDENEKMENFLLENRMEITAVFLTLIKEMTDPLLPEHVKLGSDSEPKKKQTLIFGLKKLLGLQQHT